ncbi:MAG: hypothetical protein ACTSR8_16125 [Promethearchaeota archaeon]
MLKKTKVYFYYCDYCKKEVHNPIKRPLTSFQKQIWVIVILATLGFALIALIIYRLYLVKKGYCPTCISKLRISEDPSKIKELVPKNPSTAKEQVLEKVEELGGVVHRPKTNFPNSEELEKIYCPFCGEELEKDTYTCPYCMTAIKF